MFEKWSYREKTGEKTVVGALEVIGVPVLLRLLLQLLLAIGVIGIPIIQPLLLLPGEDWREDWGGDWGEDWYYL